MPRPEIDPTTITLVDEQVRERTTQDPDSLSFESKVLALLQVLMDQPQQDEGASDREPDGGATEPSRLSNQQLEEIMEEAKPSPTQSIVEQVKGQKSSSRGRWR